MGISFEFDPATHAYTVDGVRVPSVTQCLQSVGVIDYAAVPADTLDYKREIGSVVDAFADFIDEDDADWAQVKGSAIEGYCLAYEAFRLHSGFVAASKKRRGVMKCNGALCGWECDREGLWGGKPNVVDLKCTAAIERSVGPQLAAYEHALFMEDGRHRHRLAVQLLPDGTWKAHPMRDPMDLHVFQWALALTTWKGTR